jgi:hypothetical protein
LVLIMGIAFFFLFVGMVVALYFGYQRIERERAEVAADEWRVERIPSSPAASNAPGRLRAPSGPWDRTGPR